MIRIMLFIKGVCKNYFVIIMFFRVLGVDFVFWILGYVYIDLYFYVFFFWKEL